MFCVPGTCIICNQTNHEIPYRSLVLEELLSSSKCIISRAKDSLSPCLNLIYLLYLHIRVSTYYYIYAARIEFVQRARAHTPIDIGSYVKKKIKLNKHRYSIFTME